MTDDWRDAEEDLYWIDQKLRWRPIVAAMRRLVAAIKADPRFHDLRPSMSHDALVFRRGANPEVWISWLPDEEVYEVSEVVAANTGLAVRAKAHAAAIGPFLDRLSEYLDRSPVDRSSGDHAVSHANDDAGEWNAVEAEYKRLADYEYMRAFVARMDRLVAAIRTTGRFHHADPRIARDDCRAGAPRGSLVFRLLSKRSVWAWWDAPEATYNAALIEGDTMLQHARSASLSEVVDLLVGYLDQRA